MRWSTHSGTVAPTDQFQVFLLKRVEVSERVGPDSRPASARPPLAHPSRVARLPGRGSPEASEGWRRGWDSHHCRLLKTKNLRALGFLRIRQIRTKTEVETRIEHVRRSEPLPMQDDFGILVLASKSKRLNNFLNRASWLLLALEAGFCRRKGRLWGQSAQRLIPPIPSTD